MHRSSSITQRAWVLFAIVVVLLLIGGFPALLVAGGLVTGFLAATAAPRLSARREPYRVVLKTGESTSGYLCTWVYLKNPNGMTPVCAEGSDDDKPGGGIRHSFSDFEEQLAVRIERAEQQANTLNAHTTALDMTQNKALPRAR